jgi:hypothetical protein
VQKIPKLPVHVSDFLKIIRPEGGNMRPSEKSEANSSITPHERIKNIEVHCWKIHAEAFVGAAGLGFSAPAGAADRLIWKDMGSLDRKQNAAS